MTSGNAFRGLWPYIGFSQAIPIAAGAAAGWPQNAKNWTSFLRRMGVGVFRTKLVFK